MVVADFKADVAGERLTNDVVTGEISRDQAARVLKHLQRRRDCRAAVSEGEPIWSGHPHWLALGIALDVLLNALSGGLPYQTVSCRIGLSIRAGGWASKVAWPQWFVDHCFASIYEATV